MKTIKFKGQSGVMVIYTHKTVDKTPIPALSELQAQGIITNESDVERHEDGYRFKMSKYWMSARMYEVLSVFDSNDDVISRHVFASSTSRPKMESYVVKFTNEEFIQFMRIVNTALEISSGSSSIDDVGGDTINDIISILMDVHNSVERWEISEKSVFTISVETEIVALTSKINKIKTNLISASNE